jgi:hypothetical protein
MIYKQQIKKLNMKKTIITPLLTLFMGLTFSNIAIGGFLSDDYKCRLQYIKLDASTGLKEQGKNTYIFSDYGCGSSEAHSKLAKKVGEWLELSTNNILEETFWEGLECKKDEASFGILFGADWGQYSACSENNTMKLITKIADAFPKQVSNQVKFPKDYPEKNAYDDM